MTGLENEIAGLTKDVLTAAATCGTGDAIAQFANSQKNDDESVFGLDNKNFEFDMRRTLSYATFGAIYTGGFQHFLFAELQDTISDPIARLVLNQGLIIPLAYYPLLVWFVPLLRARSSIEKEELRSSIDVFSMIPKNWAFWFPLQFIQFNYIPSDLQVAYCALVGLLWNIILSLFTGGSQPQVEPAISMAALDEQEVEAALPPTVGVNVNQATETSG